MTNIEKIQEIEKVIVRKSHTRETYVQLLGKISDIMCYGDYMITEPICYHIELERANTADYELCAALLMMILSEEYFDSEVFHNQYEKEYVFPILKRMIYLLES